jgi:hypothetical protein
MIDFDCIFKTDPKGKASIINRNALNQYFLDNPESEFKVIFKKVTEQSNKLRAYYFAEVVNKCKIGLRGCGYNFTTQQTHEFLKMQYPDLIDEIEVNGKITTRVKSIKELDNKSFLEYIEFLKQFAVENLYIIINDPNE